MGPASQRSSTTRRAVAVLLAAQGLMATAAKAEGPPRLRLEVRGACPDRARLEAALAEALPGTQLADAKALDTTPPEAAGLPERWRAVVVEDLGSAVRVDAWGEASRTLVDPARSCGERANQVALLVALAIEPPGREELPPVAQAAAAPAATSQRTIPSPSTRTSSRWLLDLAVAGLVVGTPQAGGALSGGGGLRLTLSRGVLGGSLGVAGLSAARLAYDAGQVEAIRLPVDVDIDVSRRGPRVDLGLQLGVAVVPVVATGASFAPNRQSVGVDAGARLAVALTLHLGRWLSPQLTLEALALPLRSTLAVTNRADLGELPAWFLGASLGLSFRISGRSEPAAPTLP